MNGKLYVLEEKVDGKWYAFFHYARPTRDGARKLLRAVHSGSSSKWRIALYVRKESANAR